MATPRRRFPSFPLHLPAARRPPLEVPDALHFELLESWRAWQQEHFPAALESVGPDPVIARFGKRDQDMMSLSSSTYSKKGKELRIVRSGLMDDGAWGKYPQTPDELLSLISGRT